MTSVHWRHKFFHLHLHFHLLYAIAWTFVLLHLVQGVPPVEAKATALPDLYEASVLELQEALDLERFSSVDLVKVCFFSLCYPRS